MNYKQPVTIPVWLVVLVAVFLVLGTVGGGYGFKEYRAEKKALKDSLESRQLDIYRLEESIYNAVNYESEESEETVKWKNKYYYEQSLRKEAEDELFIFKSNTREYILRFLTNYKSKRNRATD